MYMIWQFLISFFLFRLFYLQVSHNEYTWLLKLSKIISNKRRLKKVSCNNHSIFFSFRSFAWVWWHDLKASNAIEFMWTSWLFTTALPPCCHFSHLPNSALVIPLGLWPKNLFPTSGTIFSLGIRCSLIFSFLQCS